MRVQPICYIIFQSETLSYGGECVQKLFYVGMGGFIGSVFRYLIAVYAPKLLGNQLPYGTLLVNAAGAVFIGLIMELGLCLSSDLISSDLKLFLTTGIMGGFTTFSTFSYETVSLLSAGKYRTGLVNIVLNLTFGLGGIVFGKMLAHRVV